MLSVATQVNVPSFSDNIEEHPFVKQIEDAGYRKFGFILSAQILAADGDGNGSGEVEYPVGRTN